MGLDLEEVFARHNDEHLHFERIEHKLSTRPDLHGFLLLDHLDPRGEDIVTCAEHNQIWLAVDLELLAKTATDGDIIELIRCGFWYDRDCGSLATFV